jgi:hypothetical protein
VFDGLDERGKVVGAKAVQPRIFEIAEGTLSDAAHHLTLQGALACTPRPNKNEGVLLAKGAQVECPCSWNILLVMRHKWR